MTTINYIVAQADCANMTGNGIKLFQNSDLNCTIEVIERNGEPWIFAKEVCEALGYSNISKALLNVREKWKGITSRDTLKGKQSVSIINEAGLFALVMKSKMPKAVEFQDWVCEEVLPSIRKTGGYMTTRPEDTPEQIMARAVLLAQDAIKRKDDHIHQLEAERERNAAYVIYGKSVEVANGSKLIGTYAKMLTQGGMIIGEKRLFALLRELGILGKTGSRYNEPCQYHIEKGYFRVTTRTITHSDGVEQTKITLRLLPKGQIWLTDKFYKLWNTNPEVFTPFVGKGSCLRLDMKEYIARGDMDDVA
ncbi:phage antirepressor KilAC domain-containing protein [uncultured Akkermansia sp.]|uniref:BRO family protein n=1 Tax=uncultured Akkermansia sp. TaxID=512294 RepID=UPI002633FBA4|nr:phage antirepressor KilAC domain-containing protein [uncultured Akkermansia sp.]